MAADSNKDSLHYRRSLVIAPKTTTQFNQFLPTKDKPAAYVPAPLRKKRAERHEDSRRSWASPMYTEEDGTFTSETRSESSNNRCISQNSLPAAHLQWAYEYESGSDDESDPERPDPDLVLDDLASRRFHSPSPAPPTNYALPISPVEAGNAVGLGGGGGGVSVAKGGTWPMVTMTTNTNDPPRQTVTCLSSSGPMTPMRSPQPQMGSVRVDHRHPLPTDSLLRQMYDDSEDEEDDVGYADPVQDDLYARKVGVSPKPPVDVSYDRFLPKFWTPEEDAHMQKIKLGSQRRPWYKKIQGFSRKKSGSSSSDDSDCDVSRWLSSAPSGPSPSSHPHVSEGSTHTSHPAADQRLLQKHDVASDGSKSMTDLAVDLKQVRYEELQKIREQVKENEDQWQDDLTKWKNRRKSFNSDIVKKKEERERSTASTGGGSGGLQRSNWSSIGSRLNSLASLDQDVFEDSAPVRRTFPPRSYTIDNPYPYTTVDRLSTTSSSVPPPKEEAPAATTATNRAGSPSRGNMSDSSDSSDSPSGSGSDITNNTTTVGRTSNYNPYVPAPTPSEKAPSPASRYTSTAKMEETLSTTTTTTPSFLPKAPEPSRPWVGKVSEEVTPSTGGGSPYKQQPQYNSVVMDPKPMPPGVSRVSASLPRSYMRSDSARLTSVVTPRPFGSQSTRVASLPCAYTAPQMGVSQKRVNGETDVTKKPLAPSRYSQVMTSEDEARSLSSSAHSSGGEEEEEEEERERGATPTLAPTLAPSQARIPSPALQTPKVTSPATVSPLSAKDTNQESYADMRISLNQKPNSSRDFGFQTEWDSTGAHITSIQPGSPAELCQLQVGDEVLSVSGQRVAEMSYGKWKSSTEQALQQGSLTMDIRRHGSNNWDRDLPSMPFKSHKTINLTSMDHHPTLIGSTDTTTVNAVNATTSLDFTSRGSMETTKEVTTQPIIDVASNGENGGFRDETVTMRNKEPISMKNLKRRSEFFEQGGSESAISDMPVASIAPSSNHWSWDPEEERRRQEKWQKEQERILQEKYRRDQEKLEEEWRRAQQEAVTEGGRHHQEEPRGLEVDSRNISPLSPLRKPTAPWEDKEAQEKERRRREEEEAQRRQEEEERRRVEEERRREEEEERELLRLQKERKSREKQEDEERRQREEEKLRWQRKEEEREESRRQEAAEQQHREKEKMQEQQQQQWAKSKSTPELDDVEKPETKGWYGRSGGMAQRLLEEELRRKADKKAQSLRAASELELERRNILNAMRYREPERVTSSGGLGEMLWSKGQQSLPQAELERQQILQEMKKKTQLSTDNSWIRQRSTTTSKDPTASPIRRGESLDNLDTAPHSSWRSSWTPGSTSSIPNYSRPHSALSGLNTTSSYSGGGYGSGGYGSGGYSGGGAGSRPGSATLPSSLSMSSLRGAGGSNPSSWSQPTPSSLAPTPSPGPEPESRPFSQQRSRSVSGKKICTFCDTVLGKGAAMIIESLGLCYHLTCFKCIDCKSDLGGSEAGAEVRIRNRQLYCNSCYMRFKTGQPNSM
ncbi:LIM domain only protein 7 isoform X3 [Coregonus clupeaformis]|uniref:LIM domain only protein 7 isoform X3 n=1 Tax=Coregonus clupeaformis TaxID=59861 RepID=UPI001E1C9781|nr:LIM domain only protein 7 isoform X3 [Coregonus clupeaformis]